MELETQTCPFLNSPSIDTFQYIFCEKPSQIGVNVKRVKAPRPFRSFSPLVISKSIDTLNMFQKSENFIIHDPYRNNTYP